MRYVKLWGLPHSGTNLIRYALEANYDCRVLSSVLGFKHGKPTTRHTWNERSWYPKRWSPAQELYMARLHATIQKHRVDLSPEEVAAIKKAIEARELHYLLTIRNPYAYACCVAREKMPGLRKLGAARLRVLMTDYAKMLADYRAFAAIERRASVEHWEDFSEPRGLERVAHRHGLTRRKESLPGEPKLPAKRVRKRGDHPPELEGEMMDLEFYRQERYLRQHTAETIGIVNEAVPEPLMQWAGYPRRSPDRFALQRVKVDDPRQWWNENLTPENTPEWLSQRNWGDLDHPQRRKLHEFVEKNGVRSMLDCGGGPLLEYRALRRAGFSSIAYALVEVTEKFVRDARAEGIAAFAGSIESLPIRPKSYELVYCRHVLEHAPRWRDALREMVRVATRFVYVSFAHDYAPKLIERRDPASGLQLNRYDKATLRRFVFSLPGVRDVVTTGRRMEVVLS